MAVGAASPRTASCRRCVRPCHLECRTRRRSSADHRVDPDGARAGACPCSTPQGAAAAEVADAENHGAKEAASINSGTARCLYPGAVRTERRVAPDPSAEESQDPSPQSPAKSARPTPAKGARSQVDAATDARSVRQFPQPSWLEVHQLIRHQLPRAHPRFGDRDRLLRVRLDSGESPPVASRRGFQIGATGRSDAGRAGSRRDDLHAVPHDAGLDAATRADPSLTSECGPPLKARPCPRPSRSSPPALRSGRPACTCGRPGVLPSPFRGR